MAAKTHAKPKMGVEQARPCKSVRTGKKTADIASDDRQWKAQFDASADVAQAIDDEVMEEYRSGRTTQLPDAHRARGLG